MNISENKYLYLDLKNVNVIKQCIKHIVYPIKVLKYKGILLLYKKKEVNKKYKVSICAIFKNEALYLKEWIEFHKIIGVDHFYLYNNFSDDNYKEVLESYVNEGLITLIDWPVKQGQMSAYTDCIQKYSSETNWIGFIDIDEFVVPKKESNVYDFLKKFPKRPSVLLYWKVFGTSGLKSRDMSSLVTESFTLCWDKFDIVGKCFYNTNFSFDSTYKGNKAFHHYLCGKVGNIEVPPVNAFNKFCFYNIHTFSKKESDIQINHYFTKSYDEYIQKASKGDVFFEKNPHNLDYFYAHETRCKSTDYSIFRFLIQLKNSL